MSEDAPSITSPSRRPGTAGSATGRGWRWHWAHEPTFTATPAAAAREAIDLVTSTGDRAAESVILRTVAAVEHATGRHPVACDTYCRAIDLALAAHPPYEATQALLGIGALADELGRMAEAERDLSQAASIASEHSFELASSRAAALLGK